jgi:glycosyltransferase involved in cell wall biosynthesis
VRLLVTSEGHYFRDPNGEISIEGPLKYSFWSSYLEIFDDVTVLARVAPGGNPWPESARADGPAVTFSSLPDYVGPWGYLRNLKILRTSICRAISQSDAFILRVPGLVARSAWHEIRRSQKPYALEVVGDPWDALAPDTWPSLSRPMLRLVGALELKLMCKDAVAVHYVTEGALQQRYPASKSAYSAGYSDALMDSAFVGLPILDEKHRRMNLHKPFHMGFIGSLAQLYKGPDLLLKAAAICRSCGLDFELVLVGDGHHASAMNALAERLGIKDQTRFLGQLAVGQAIRDFLDSIDLFVMPSRAEGLPRALLEAMARGCPCIGSNIGGIPELLAVDDLVPTNDPKALAQKIMEVTANPKRMKAMSERNLARAKQFDPETLRVARRAFYQYVRDHSTNAGNIEEKPQ